MTDSYAPAFACGFGGRVNSRENSTIQRPYFLSSRLIGYGGGGGTHLLLAAHGVQGEGRARERF